GGRKKYKL
nr:Chain C, HIV-1 GAG PEPTIDE (GGRKKYKL - 3R MUTATION)